MDTLSPHWRVLGSPGSPPVSPLTLEAMNCPRPGGKVTEARSSTTSTVYTGLLQEGHGGLGAWGRTDGRTGGRRDTGVDGVSGQGAQGGHMDTQGG